MVRGGRQRGDKSGAALAQQLAQCLFVVRSDNAFFSGRVPGSVEI
jgi:hypothetical protein